MQLNNPIFINQTDADIRYVNTTGDTVNGVLNTTGLVVSGLGTPFILKSPNNSNSVYFDPTINGNAGILRTQYISTISMYNDGDQNLSLIYGGGGTRSLIFRGFNGSVTKNDVLIDSNGNFGIASGISSVPSKFYVSGDSVLQGNLTVSGNAIIDGDILRSGNSIYPLMGPAFPRGTNKRVHIPAGTTYSTLGGAPVTTNAASGHMSLNPYYLPTDMTGTDIFLTSYYYVVGYGQPTNTGILAFGIYDAKSGLENSVLMESFFRTGSNTYTEATVFRQQLSKFYPRGWYITVAARVFSGVATGAISYNTVNPQNLHIFGTPSGSANYTTTSIPNGYSQSTVLSVTGMTYPLPDSFSSIPLSSFVIGAANPAPPVYLMY